MHTIWQIYLHIEQVSIFGTAKGNWNLLHFTWKLSEPLNILPSWDSKVLLPATWFELWAVNPPGNDHMSHLGKRTIIDSEACWDGFVFFPGRYRICFHQCFCRGVFAAFVELFFFWTACDLESVFFSHCCQSFCRVYHMFTMLDGTISHPLGQFRNLNTIYCNWMAYDTVYLDKHNLHFIFQCFLARMARTRTLSSFQWPLSNETCWWPSSKRCPSNTPSISSWYIVHM